LKTRIILAFDNEDFHSNGYSSGPRSTTSDILTNESSQGFYSFRKLSKNVFISSLVNPIRTVNWPELLPKITINIDSNRFHPISNGKKNVPFKIFSFENFLLLDETKDDENNNSSNHDDDPSNDEDSNENENSSYHNDDYPTSTIRSSSSLKDKHVRRPMNSFMLFSQEQRAKIHLANPNRDNRNVSKILGEKWYSLSANEQDQYRIRAKQLRNEHSKQNPSFKWTNQPTKLNNSNHLISNKDEQEQCRRSARLQSQSNQDKNISPYCDRLQAFAQVLTLFI
jgi:hypothetical protein